MYSTDANLHIVARDADLLGDVQCLLFEAVSVGNPFNEWNQDMKTGVQRAAVLAEGFDDVRALLRNDGRGLADHNDGDDGEHDEYI